MRAVPRFSRRRNTLNPSGICLWRPALGDPRRSRLSRQMEEFLVFIAIFEQHVVIMSSLWGSPNGIRLWRPASWGPTAAAPEPPNGRIPCIYRYWGTTCRQIVEFMAFGACQTPQSRRPWRTSQAQTVGEFWWLNPNRQSCGWTLAWQPVGGKSMARATPSARFLETEPRRWKNETLMDRLRPQRSPTPYHGVISPSPPAPRVPAGPP